MYALLVMKYGIFVCMPICTYAYDYMHVCMHVPTQIVYVFCVSMYVRTHISYIHFFDMCYHYISIHSFDMY